MKKISIILAALTILAMFAMTVNAAGTSSSDVLIGTPDIDGVIDDIYYESAYFTLTTADPCYNTGAEYSDASEFEATSYLLYDDKNIYIAVEVTDATPNYVAEDKIAAGYVWQNDVCEFWLSMDNGTTWGQFNMDAAGYGVTVGVESAFTSKSVCNGAATQTDDGYIVEVSFPNTLEAGDDFVYQLQANNGLNADFSKLVCIGYQKNADRVFVLSDEEAVIEVIEEAPATDTATEAVTSTSTADPITALLAIAIAGAGVVVCKKTRK